MRGILRAFYYGWRSAARISCREDKKMRENLSERQIDKMVEASFPASDPPSTY